MEEKTRAYTKSRLVKELAFRAGIKKVASRQILEVLVEIIKRETPNAPFVIPGLCKFELVPRKIRNPRTGASLIMPPQKALKVTPSRAVKMAVAPRIPAVPAEEYVPPSEPEQDVSAATPVVAPAPTPAPEPVPTPVSEPPKVEEPPKAEASKPAECPQCGLLFEVPFFSDAGSIHDEHKKAESSAAQLAAQKRATMRIDLSDNF